MSAGHQGMALLRKDWEVWLHESGCGFVGRHGFVGGNVSLRPLRVDFEVSKTHDGPKCAISHPPSLLPS